MSSEHKLDDAARKLPDGIRPPRDLWPEIRMRIEAAAGPVTAPRFTPGRWGAIAASLLIVAAGVMLVTRSGVGERPEHAADPAVALPASHTETDLLLAAEHEFLEATKLLLAAVEQRQGTLSPKTAETLEEDPSKLFFKGGAKSFFFKGNNGRWRDVLSEADLVLYEDAKTRVLTPDCAKWLEDGGPV